MSSEDKSNAQQAKAAEVAKEIKEGEKSLKGTEKIKVTLSRQRRPKSPERSRRGKSL